MAKLLTYFRRDFKTAGLVAIGYSVGMPPPFLIFEGLSKALLFFVMVWVLLSLLDYVIFKLGLE